MDRMKIYVRVSIGTLSLLKIIDVKMDAVPYTAYLLQYGEKGCMARCLFCSQSIVNSSNKIFVSRISWPKIELDKLVESLKKNDVFKRICIQSIIKPGFEKEIYRILKRIREGGVNIPISVATTPIIIDYMHRYRDLGVDFYGIGLDAASPDVFKRMGKPYTWNIYLKFIENAVKIFGWRKVNVHLIYGLGESMVDFIKCMEKIYNIGGEVALFAFTPIRNTKLSNRSQPSLSEYRLIQLIRFLLSKRYRLDEIIYIENGKVFLRDLKDWNEIKYAFLTSGCPYCNRPFYNESPRKIYNYPNIEMVERDRCKIIKDLLDFIR